MRQDMTGKECAIDYLDRGEWGLCTLEYSPDADHPRIRDVVDTDSDIHNLVLRAVVDWGVSPHALWISECGRQLLAATLNGIEIGE